MNDDCIKAWNNLFMNKMLLEDSTDILSVLNMYPSIFLGIHANEKLGAMSIVLNGKIFVILWLKIKNHGMDK